MCSEKNKSSVLDLGAILTNLLYFTVFAHI